MVRVQPLAKNGLVIELPKDTVPLVIQGHVMEALPKFPRHAVSCIVTSPPYPGMRDYAELGGPDYWGDCSVCKHVWVPRKVFPWGQDADPKPVSIELCRKCNGWRGYLGLEEIIDCGAAWRREKPCSYCFVCHIRRVAGSKAKDDGLWRILRDDGVFYLNIGPGPWSGYRGAHYGDTEGNMPSKMVRAKDMPGGDAYVATPKTTGLQEGNLVFVAAMVARALQVDGWMLRQDNIWSKIGPGRESVNGVRWEPHFIGRKRDNVRCRGCTKCRAHNGYVLRRGSWRSTREHEYVFMFTKRMNYYSDREAVAGSLSKATLARISQRSFDEQNGGPRDFAQGRASSIRASLEALKADPHGRNLRSVWDLPTAQLSEDHPAAFSWELAETCIKPSVPLAGYCAKCGEPWARVIDLEALPDRPGRVQRVSDPKTKKAHGSDGRDGNRITRVSRTVGWWPTCECKTDLSPTRPVVLDPFCGSGTTLEVGRSLDCITIGIDKSPKYVALSKKLAAEETETGKQMILEGW